MLFLLFELGSDRYAVDVGQIAEVLPLVHVTRIPQAPDGVVGVFNFRGVPVPVVDLSEIALGRASLTRLSTRLVLVHYPDGQNRMRLLGVIVEHATTTIRREPGDFVASGVTPGGAPYLGPVTTDARGVIQRIDPAKLLPPSVRDVLFAGREAHA
jgi:chemotaxis-related protein WspB